MHFFPALNQFFCGIVLKLFECSFRLFFKKQQYTFLELKLVSLLLPLVCTLQGYTLTSSLLCSLLPRVRWCSILQLCLWWGRGASGTIPSQTPWILPSTFITFSSSQSCSTSLVSSPLSLLPIQLQPVVLCPDPPDKWKRVWCSERHFLSHGMGATA